MHEQSLVKTLIDQVQEESRIRGLGRVHEVHLRVGEFSGIEPRLLESAFAEMAPAYWDTLVQLSVEVMPLTATCETCHEVFHVEGFHFVCPRCGGNVQVIAGEEMQLVSLRAERQAGCEEVSQ